MIHHARGCINDRRAVIHRAKRLLLRHHCCARSADGKRRERPLHNQTEALEQYVQYVC